MADKFEGRVYNDFGMVNLDEMKNLLWTRVKSEDYEEPKKGYVPKDPKLDLSGRVKHTYQHTYFLMIKILKNRLDKQ
jgi:hypothetical protein